VVREGSTASSGVDVAVGSDTLRLSQVLAVHRQLQLIDSTVGVASQSVLLRGHQPPRIKT
jgi:hypothetical protein